MSHVSYYVFGYHCGDNSYEETIEIKTQDNSIQVTIEKRKKKSLYNK